MRSREIFILGPTQQSKANFKKGENPKVDF
jgi:hypothetical protein